MQTRAFVSFVMPYQPVKNLSTQTQKVLDDMLKVYILIVVLGLVGGVVYGGWYYYKDTQARIQTLTENSAKIETAAKLQKNTIDTLQADAKKYAKLNILQLPKQLQFNKLCQIHNILEKKSPSYLESIVLLLLLL